ncbi:MAG: M28 family peptidase, partial [Armatimonadetes bacterium]|nr:M28 family peptidase [Armatimonadota bacterium]
MKENSMRQMLLFCLCIIVFGIASKVFGQSVSIYRELYNGVDERNLRSVVENLSSLGSRVVGYPGEGLAAEYVRQKFIEIGLDAVREQTFYAVTPIEETPTYMEIPRLGKRYRIYPLWPNLVRTSQTPPDGLKGHLIYAGVGRLESFNGKKVAGSIALMDFNSSTDWLNAIFLGGKAILFIEPEDTFRGEAELKFLTTPIDIPRYWMPRKDALELLSLLERQKDLEAVINCRMTWKKVPFRNIEGIIWGVDPKRRNEVLVVQAYYDSMSVVPSLAPGAEQACSIAALFELARLLKRYPPDRTVVFLANSAHCLGLRGESLYIYDWLQKEKENDAAIKEGKAPSLLTFVSIDLSTRTPICGIFYKGYFWDYHEDRQWQFSDIGKLCRETVERVGLIFGFQPETRFVDAINPIKGKSWRTYCLGRLALGSEMATIAAKTGIAFATVNDARPYVDTPFDTIDKVNFDNLKAQVQIIACALY